MGLVHLLREHKTISPVVDVRCAKMNVKVRVWVFFV
jgi:hypothetical protein